MPVETTISASEIWNKASVSGLLLGAVTVLFMLVQEFLIPELSQGGSFGGNLLGSISGILLKIAKIAVCLLLLRNFLKRFAAGFPTVTNARVAGYGIKIALFSSLIVTAYFVADILFVNPEQYTEAFNTLTQQYSSTMDANTLSALDGMMARMPLVGGITTFLYCFVWGWIASLVMSRDIPSGV